MVGVNNITLSFGGKDLFSQVTFLINPGERIGLVGRNGAGKSTLLKILSGWLKPDEGNISTPKEFTIGYLSQDIHLKKGVTVWEETESTFTEIKSLERTIDEINHDLAERTDYESDSYLQLIEDLNTANDRMNMIGGFTYQADMEKVLIGLGFTSEDFHKPIETFSGGWQMRIELAKLLLQRNDLLLLDEPTNHLDIESIMWLEDFLSQQPSAVVLVSHDRTFLNNVTTRTIEISLGRTYDFPVPYSKYLSLREEQKQTQLQAQKNQEKEIKHTEQLIEKFRAKASKASFAQSLIKKLDRMDRIEVDEDDTRTMHFRFPPAPRSGKVVIKGEGIRKNFGDKQVLLGVDLEVERHDRIAFVGKNGMGKSTLVKILIGELDHTGTVEMGHNVDVGYFAQNQAEKLDGNKTVLATIEDASSEENRKNARNLLGAFMFSGDQVEKKVKVLSGGERGRLALCKLMLHPHNLLILDEPTNHLDMRAKDVLKQALLQYDGTVIIVSHDRDFLNGLASKVYEFREGRVKEYLGGIDYFLEQKKLASLREYEAEKKEARKSTKSSAPTASGMNFREKREAEKEVKKFQKRLEKLEESIEAFETQLAEWDEALHDPETFKRINKEDPNFYEKYEAKREELNVLMVEWEEVQLKLEDLRSTLQEET
ncbi:MAG: ATP-binding cassette domain-containing protein [Bacteroidota bacterium]|nr:ATP-binding cassette domain-containing protein [Bacteroidota bacterium]MDX5448136.1 ATP-binding cassette domain-containing protein [Bacteroidota bacterium]MDX5506641.1 ATP-binding cassette domain-containing protein [Bacteroidota bacterium]